MTAQRAAIKATLWDAVHDAHHERATVTVTERPATTGSRSWTGPVVEITNETFSIRQPGASHTTTFYFYDHSLALEVMGADAS
jgi:hypothetical protein